MCADNSSSRGMTTSAPTSRTASMNTTCVAPGATISVAAASGVTGAGLTPRLDLLFGEVTENYRAYGVGNTHRHLNEMRALVTEVGGDVDLLFTPHLLPTARGILATITVPLVRPLTDAMAPWRDRFGAEPFIELSDAPPEGDAMSALARFTVTLRNPAAWPSGRGARHTRSSPRRIPWRADR